MQRGAETGLHADSPAGSRLGGAASLDTPGDVLVARFLKPMKLSARQVARDLNVSVNRITLIINGQRKLTAETAVLFEQRFGMSAEFWMNLQMSHDLDTARSRLSS